MRKSFLYLTMLFLGLMLPVAQAEDPDYGNDSAGAQTIVADGTEIIGVLTSGDEDWFKISNPTQKLFSVSLKGQYNTGYKVIDIYQADEFGTLHQTLSYSVWSNDTQTRTFFIEYGYDIYIRVYYNTGQYLFSVTELGEYLPDGYSNDINNPTVITAAQDPLSGTLCHINSSTLENDWFVFDTDPLHKYEVKVTCSNNTAVYGSLYNASNTILYGGTSSTTVTSWHGEQYKVLVSGSAGYLGSYYTLDVIDLGPVSDDYANESSAATVVPTDGSKITGVVNYSSTCNSDLDWFKFTPTANTLYRITFKGEVGMGYKVMEIFQADVFGDLHQTLNFSSWSGSSEVRTFFAENAYDIYLKAHYNDGAYEYYLEPIGYFPPDGSTDTCSNPMTIAVGAAPVKGTLSHYSNGSLENDWYIFNTNSLHKYEIRVTSSSDCVSYIYLYDQNCSLVLNGSSTTHTVTSWAGEPFKICVGSSNGYLGVSYTLEVVDVGTYTDDYPSTLAQAVTVPYDGTVIEGAIQFSSSYQADQDWFKFTAPQAGIYQFSLTGEYGRGYKIIDTYRRNELGAIYHISNQSVWSDSTNKFSLTLPQEDIFMKVYSDEGKYSLSVLSPEARCGDLDHPIPSGDVNKDCVVDMKDLALLAGNWLKCTAPSCVVSQ